MSVWLVGNPTWDWNIWCSRGLLTEKRYQVVDPTLPNAGCLGNIFGSFRPAHPKKTDGHHWKKKGKVAGRIVL